MTLPNFQVIGDMTHLTAIVLLPMKLQWSTDASGVSLTTQELYLLVFLTRYLGIFVYSVSLYNSAMKILFVSYTAMTIAMLRFQPLLKASCETSGSSSEGWFRPWLHAIFPSLILATVVCILDFGFEIHGFSSFQAFWWTFSEILEPLAIVPQLLVLQRSRNSAGVVIWCYVLLMAVYRALYILAWMQTMCDEPRCAHQYLLYFAALTQTFIYVLFFVDRFYHRRDRDRRAPVESDGGAMEIETGFYGARQRLLPYFPSSPASFASLDSGAYFGVASKDSRRRDEEWA